jgi:hypothetical protein
VAASIGGWAFSYTGDTALTVTLGHQAPTLGWAPFYDDGFLDDDGVHDPKAVTVRVPFGASGYDDAWKASFCSDSDVTLTIEEYTP